MPGSSSTLENLYDSYSPMLYSLALKISPSIRDAENILMLTFKKIEKQNPLQIEKLKCIELCKLLIEVGRQQFGAYQVRNSYKKRQFENSSLLNRILFEQLNLADYCEENNLTRSQGIRKMRQEYLLIQNVKQEV